MNDVKIKFDWDNLEPAYKFFEDKTLTTLFPTYWPQTLDAYRNYGAMEVRTLEVVKLFAKLGCQVNVLAPKGSHLPIKNVKVLTGDYGSWGGSGVHPYHLEKNLVECNLDALKASDAVLDDSVRADTPILIRENQKILRVIPIEDLMPTKIVGDGHHEINNIEVWSDEGWTKIAYVWRHKITDDLSRISTRKGFIEITKNHSLVIDGEKVCPQDLDIGCYVDGCPIELPEDLEIDVDFAWLLGFFVAEGYAAKVKHKSQGGFIYVWELYNQKKNLLERAQKVLDRFGLKSWIELRGDDVYRLKMSTPQNWAIYFRNLCYSKKNREKIIPNMIFRAKIDVQKSFVRGYWDGDGHYDPLGYSNFCESKSKALIAGIALLVNTFGREYNVYKHDHNNRIYMILKLNKRNKNPQLPFDIKHIDGIPVRNEFVYDLETTNHHFCAGIGNILCHNTHFRGYTYLKSKNPNEYPHSAFSFDFHNDQISTLPLYPQNIVCVSKWLLSALREKFKNQGHKFWHAYSGLIRGNYPSEFDPSLVEKDLYLYLCRFSKVKSPAYILELAKENPDDRFVLLGDAVFSNEPHYAMAIKNIADKMPNVKVIFNASYEEKIDYLQRSVGLLHPGSWCIPPYETIMTKDGMIPISEIRVGSEVLTHDGTFQKVKNVLVKWYDGNLIRIHPRYSSPFDVTSEHKIMTNDGYKHACELTMDDMLMRTHPPSSSEIFKRLKTSDIVEFPAARFVKVGTLDGTNIIFRRYTTKFKKSYEYMGEQTRGHPFPEYLEIDDIFLHLCAAYIAKGVSEEDYLGFAIGKKEYCDIWKEISERLLCNFKVKDEKNRYKISIHSRVHSQIFKKWFGKGAKNKHLPDWVWNLSDNHKEILLNHLINYDGHIETRIGLKAYTTVSKTLAYQIQMLTRSIGINASVIKAKDHYGSGVADRNKIFTGAYTVKLYTKSSKYFMHDRENEFVSVCELKNIPYMGLVYDIEVEKNHNFALNAIQVSNSEPLGWDMLEGLYFGSRILAFDRGAAREIYRNKEQGIIAPFTNNEAQNIDIYKRAFKIYKKLDIKPEDCRQRVLDNFDFSLHSFPKYIDVLFPQKKS